jgi:DNA-binding transcriptional regulator YiaG
MPVCPKRVWPEGWHGAVNPVSSIGVTTTTATTHNDDATLVVDLMDARDAARSGRGARIRRAASLSQGDLARACGVDVSTISRWESGERRPSGDAGRAYARVLRAVAKELVAP